MNEPSKTAAQAGITLLASDLNPEEMYLMLRDSVMPRPIGWVSTVDAQGRPNLAPYSFFNVCSPEPPVVGFAVGPRSGPGGVKGIKDTLANVRETREMVVNIVPDPLDMPMVETSANLAPGESEFEFAGLEPVASVDVKPPRVKGAPVAYECRLYTILEIGTHYWVMGEVVRVHLDERVYLGRVKAHNHRIDLTRLPETRPLGRLGRAQYVRLSEIDVLMRRDGPND